MENILFKILTTLFCCFYSLTVLAQIEEVEVESVDTQYWLDYNVSYDLKNNFTAYGDTGWRTISSGNWKRYYIRPAISFTQFSKTKSKNHLKLVYHIGIGTFFTNYSKISNQLEIRPFQGINLEWTTLKRLHINQYIRLEEQFEYFDKNWEFGLRARYMLAGTLDFYKKWGKTLDQFYLPFHVELFFNLDKSAGFNDVIRLTPGLGYIVNEAWRLEFSTSYHRRKFEKEENFKTNDIVFRFRVFHNLN